jgi:hypothetical protein
MKLKSILFAALVALTLSSCEKIAGPGGTSSITGTVSGINSSAGQYEVIEITVTPGSILEHGDYFIVNQLSGDNFYFYFNNPVWVTSADPALQGRTGVQIDFSYDDTDLEIANKVDSVLNANLSAGFNINNVGDIITLTATEMGNIPDPDDVTTSFLVDVSNQGQVGYIGAETPMTDMRVYLCYGENDLYDESTRTGENGAFSFRDLQIGKYTVYVLSKDSLTNEYIIPVKQEIEITADGSVVETDNFLIHH